MQGEQDDKEAGQAEKEFRADHGKSAPEKGRIEYGRVRAFLAIDG